MQSESYDPINLSRLVIDEELEFIPNYISPSNFDFDLDVDIKNNLQCIKDQYQKINSTHSQNTSKKCPRNKQRTLTLSINRLNMPKVDKIKQGKSTEGSSKKRKKKTKTLQSNDSQNLSSNLNSTKHSESISFEKCKSVKQTTKQTTK